MNHVNTPCSLENYEFSTVSEVYVEWNLNKLNSLLLCCKFGFAVHENTTKNFLAISKFF